MGALELPAAWAENVKWPRAPEEVLIPAIIRAVRIEPWRLRPLHASDADDSAGKRGAEFPCLAARDKFEPWRIRL